MVVMCTVVLSSFAGNYLETLNGSDLVIVSGSDLSYSASLPVAEVTNSLLQETVEENCSTVNMSPPTVTSADVPTFYSTVSEMDVMELGLPIASTSSNSVHVNGTGSRNGDCCSHPAATAGDDGERGGSNMDQDILKVSNGKPNVVVVGEGGDDILLFNDEFSLNYFGITTSASASTLPTETNTRLLIPTTTQTATETTMATS